jgi:hypothetical protein
VRAQRIVAAWAEQKVVREIMVFLARLAFGLATSERGLADDRFHR